MFKPLHSNPQLELVIVMVVAPGVLNVVQFWIMDNFLSKRLRPEKDDGVGEEGRGVVGGVGGLSASGHDHHGDGGAGVVVGGAVGGGLGGGLLTGGRGPVGGMFHAVRGDGKRGSSSSKSGSGKSRGCFGSSSSSSSSSSGGGSSGDRAAGAAGGSGDSGGGGASGGKGKGKAKRKGREDGSPSERDSLLGGDGDCPPDIVDRLTLPGGVPGGVPGGGCGAGSGAAAASQRASQTSGEPSTEPRPVTPVERHACDASLSLNA